MIVKKVSVFLLMVAGLLPAAIARPQAFQQPYGIESQHDIENIAPIRQQILKEEEWLRWRKEHIVPEVMRRVGVDVWRSEGDDFVHSWEDRFVVTEGVVPSLGEVISAVLAKAGIGASDLARAAIYSHDPRTLGTVAKGSGIKPDQLQDPLAGRVGNTGCAFAPMLLVGALEAASGGQKILCASYGDGAHALVFETTDAISGLAPSYTV